MALTKEQFFKQIEDAINRLGEEYEGVPTPGESIVMVHPNFDVESVISKTDNPSEVRKNIYVPIVNTQGQVEIQYRSENRFSDTFNGEDSFVDMVDEFGGSVKSTAKDSVTFTIDESENLNVFKYLNKIPASWVKSLGYDESSGVYTATAVQGPNNSGIGNDYTRVVEQEAAEDIRLGCPECDSITVVPDKDSSGFFCTSCYTAWNSADLKDAYNEDTAEEIREALEDAFAEVDSEESDLDVEYETTNEEVGGTAHISFLTFEEDGSPAIGVRLDGRDVLLDTIKTELRPKTTPENRKCDKDSCEFCDETEGAQKVLVNYPNENGGVLRLTRICDEHLNEVVEIAEGITQNDSQFKMTLAVNQM